ncbi:hypothetical protein [Nocardiopsis halotolerans]|uniref:hypothetical protein n=1 Tax=Nocardiopsis halotolerans TaxID=124252 RepID=UPI00034510AD|nr:hypothetical protein [Nocardiopsis halotolerans]
MNRDTRSTVLALFSVSLLTLGVTGFSQEAAGAEPRGAEIQSADDGSEGFTGTLSGEVVYLAPGEYIVNDQAFHVTEDTRILGGLYTCAPEVPTDDMTGTVECGLGEFESELRDGTVVLAGVEVVDGVARTITEFQA